MKELKLLIDTNIIIGLEDHKEITASFSKLLQQCQKHGVKVFVHEASKEDIARDKDAARKQIILSKLEKFLPIEGIHIPPIEELSATYGHIGKSNDHIDVILLYTLHQNIIDFLVTQDRGLHKRASYVGLEDRIFRVEDALVWLRDTFEKISVSLPYIEERQCHQLNQRDDIFVSLREDYNGFDSWFVESCVKSQRECWTIHFQDEIAGIAIRKDESLEDLLEKVPTSSSHFVAPPSKILKICTFKIKTKFRGEKLGEQLLKQILWWSHKNSYDFVYLTVFPKHKYLIDMLVQYGFNTIGRSEGELFLGKVFANGIFEKEPYDDALEYHRKYYPSYVSDEPIGKYLVPIRGEYYSTLFPENVSPVQFGLFGSVVQDATSKIPGNTIRKVYVCHSNIKKIKQGDILLFFHLKDNNSMHSQKLVSVGIVDGFDVTFWAEELMKLTAKRSVFTPEQLTQYTKNPKKPVKVINFLLAGHINPAILFDHMKTIGITGNYQSIRTISHEHYLALEKDIILDVKTT